MNPSMQAIFASREPAGSSRDVEKWNIRLKVPSSATNATCSKAHLSRRSAVARLCHQRILREAANKQFHLKRSLDSSEHGGRQ
jgi:hypothetical protein